jgi:hypothetical protein
MADILGKTGDAALFRDWADKLSDAINTHLWNEEKQGYIDSIHIDGVRSTVFSQQTQTIAYLCDVVPADKKPLFEKYLTEVPEGWVRAGSPFMMAFIIEALEKAGDVERVVGLIRKWWGIMVDNDATTCWETYPAVLGKDWHSRSHCHAWSAAPAHALPSYVLGVRPLEPAFRRFEIRPHLGDLKYARGQLPSAHGLIDVDLKRDGEAVVMTFSVPEGAVAVVGGKDYAAGTHTVRF